MVNRIPAEWRHANVHMRPPAAVRREATPIADVQPLNTREIGMDRQPVSTAKPMGFKVRTRAR